MNSSKHTLAFTLPALLLAFSAQAHDPKLHKQQTQPQSPDCAAMQQMDKDKLDMTDPVVQAMLQQCMEQMHDPKMNDSNMHDDMHEQMHSDPQDKDAKPAEKEQEQERHEGHQ